MYDISALYYPWTYLLENYRFAQLLDLSEQELVKERSLKSGRDRTEVYIGAASVLGEAYLLGGSEKYPQEWLLHELSRYAEKVFSTPGYEPFNDHPYPAID